jgi:DNA repair protein RecN (Recombination protein N)
MLKQLYIKNFTLIDELDIELHEGFSVLTGETGAGKSIILGAIGLLLGQRADSKTVKQGADRCVIEAHFDLTRIAGNGNPMTAERDIQSFFDDNDIDFDASDTIIRRELTAAGKSRAFINDTPVSLTMLKELGDQLVDVHSQHQNLLLNKQDFQLSVVDILADDAKQLSAYQQSYTDWQQKQRQLETLREDIARNSQQQDFLQFQYEELSGAKLTEGEQEELEQQSETMEHAEDIKTALYETDSSLNGEQQGAVGQVRRAINALNTIAKVLPPVAELSERLDNCHIELRDIADEVGRLLENTDFDPAELDRINNRLDRLYELEKKYHVTTVTELIALRDTLQQQLAAIENSDDAVRELEQQVNTLMATCQRQADALTKLRQKAGKEIEKQMRQRLVPLGMPNVRFEVSIASQPLGRQGQDAVSFLFSANTSTPLQPVSQVASGGEIARVMLSLKAMISSAVKLPTIIFDEIDTGVSGKIAEKMAEMMQEMGATDRQVISITHLPQIAALGSHHYRVSKEETASGTTSHMTELTADERIREIAQMLSGSDVSEAAIANARQLLKMGD